MAMAPSKRSFQLGRLLATPGALLALQDSGETALPYVARHLRGDWGEVCPGDAKLNDQAVEIGERILSAYRLGNGTKIWIITEADRAATTILLPEEY